jgi:protein tyrosine/serine phosphatase
MPAVKAVSRRNVLLCTIAVALCLTALPASAQQAITTPILLSAPNFRDLAGISASDGGTGYANPTANFGVMRTGVFYRSSVLTLSDADWTTLSAMHIFRDIDLRTPAEIMATPDRVPAGALYTNVNIFDTPSPPSYLLTNFSMASVLSTGQSGYRTFVTDPNEEMGFRTALLTLAHDPGPDLFHCSDGKDRTGWTAAILESIAGVAPATVMNDYLASNTYRAGTINSQAAAIWAAVPGLKGQNLTPLLGVDPSYLQAALDQVTASYGSMQAYLTQGLGLSQADIYVLRAKMVSYQMLPGQFGFAGNAASGAALLNALQNSPLSGNYTAYNYYLQSGVDLGTLGGVQSQVGGQVHADAASYLLRQPQWIEEALAPYAISGDLPVGQTRVWLAGLGGNFWSAGPTGAASSTETSTGAVMGATHRLTEQACVSLGAGYNWGWVGSADASATVNTFLATIGARYGFRSLEAGPFVEARGDAGYVDYQSQRALGGGLGAATGSTTGAVFSGRAGLGYVISLAPVTITPKIGIRVTDETLGGFAESGSELALNVHGLNNTSSSLLADLVVSLDRRQLGAWSITPELTLGYERVLGDPQVESTGSLYGFSVSQKSAFDSHDLMKAGLGVTVQRGSFSLTARGNGVVGDGAGSTGVSGQLSVSYTF